MQHALCWHKVPRTLILLICETCTHNEPNMLQCKVPLLVNFHRFLYFFFQTTGTPRPGDLRSVLCEGTDLDEYIQFSSQAEKEAFTNVSCSRDPQQLINAQQVFQRNLDGGKVLSEVSCLPYQEGTSQLLKLMRLGVLRSDSHTISLSLTNLGSECIREPYINWPDCSNTDHNLYV